MKCESHSTIEKRDVHSTFVQCEQATNETFQRSRTNPKLMLSSSRQTSTHDHMPTFELYLPKRKNIYHPRMRVGNVFGRVCLYVCLSVCLFRL